MAEKATSISDLVSELQDPESKFFGRDIAVDEFLRAGGPSVVRMRLDSMDGNWRAEAMNGTMDLLDKLARLPGLQRTFETVSRVKAERISAAVQAMHTHAEGDATCIASQNCDAAGQVELRRGVDIAGLHEELKSVRESEPRGKLGTRRKTDIEESGIRMTAATLDPCCGPILR